MCACYFDSDGNLIMRRGDKAVFSVESEDIPFENYEKAYFCVLDRSTLQPIMPELCEDTDSTRKVTFTYTVAQTESVAQPTEAYAVYGYAFKLCKSDGTEDTFIPEVQQDSSGNIVVKKLPKVFFYLKVIEGEA